MPQYRVMLSGTGIRIPRGVGVDPIIGFFTTRQVSARGRALAETIVLAKIAAEWKDGTYAESNKGEFPSLTIEDCWQVHWSRVLFVKRPSGYTFFTRD